MNKELKDFLHLGQVPDSDGDVIGRRDDDVSGQGVEDHKVDLLHVPP